MKRLNLPQEMESMRVPLESSIQPYIKITGQLEKTLPWESKFLGEPYFPLDAEYPRDKLGHPLKLLAQINLAEMPKLEHFPSTGILQFYISAMDDLYGSNYLNGVKQENFRIMYFPEVVEDRNQLLTDFEFLDELDLEYFPIENESRLLFSLESAPVSITDYQFETFYGEYVYDYFARFGDQEREMLKFYRELTGSGHKIGGYGDFVQGDPREDQNLAQDILLLQVDTDFDLGILWGDAGIANFFISKEDLLNLDFSNVYYNWDCY